MFVDVYRCLQMSMVYSHTPGGVVIFVIMLCGWGGAGGGGNNVHVYLHTSDRLHYGLFPCPWTYPPTHTQLAATLWYLPLPLHNDGMLRYDILHFKPLAQSCTHTQTWCYIMISSFARAQSCTHAWWYVMICPLVLAQSCAHTRRLDATLWFFLLHLNNLAQTLDATLWHLLLHLHNLAHTHTHSMLRCDIFSGTESTNGFFSHNLAKWQLTDKWKKHGTRAEETFVVRWSKHIIHEVAKRKGFLYIEVKNAGVRGAVLPLLPCYRCL